MNEKRSLIIDVSTTLFGKFGFHAVGVNKIIEMSNSSKASLYGNFASKEKLAEIVLLKRDHDFRLSLNELMRRKRTPLTKIRAVFDWYLDRYENHDFHGCIFIKAGEQFSNSESNIRKIIQGHKQWLSETLKELLKLCGVRTPSDLAEYIVVILDGLSVRVNMFNSKPKALVNKAWSRVEFLITNKL